MPSSSATKCLLPIIARSPCSVVAMPCATIYCTSACSSSWCRFCSAAPFTMALATLCGKCSSRQAAVFSTSDSVYAPNGMTFSRTGSAFVSVPVLSKTIVSASANASRYFPPLMVISQSAASRIAEITEIGVESLMAQE